MSIPMPVAESQSPNKQAGPSRRRLAIETICWAWLAALITATLQTLIWNREERLRGTLEAYNWLPINELPSILILMPLGFIVYALFPPGWLFWAGLGSTLWNRSRSFIVVAIAGAVLFGMFWPKHFVAMMGI